MSAAEHRRNGKVASCEPCRKAKIRCDHQRPICGRCQRRGLTARCYYHPAPLTKPRPSEPDASAPAASRPVSSSSPALARTPFELAASRPSDRPAPVSNFTDSPSVLPWPPASPEYRSRVPQVPRIDDDKCALVRQILRTFRQLKFIQKLLHGYGNSAQAPLVPRHFVDHFSVALTDLIAPFLDGDNEISDANLSNLSDLVIDNTSVPIKITAETNFASFVTMFSGKNTRLETVGLLQCLAARALHLGLSHDDDKHEQLLMELYSNTASCMRLCRRYATDNNDVMMWLAFDFLRVTTQIEGDTSPSVFRRMSDLALYIYEFGLQRESTITRNTPFFIAECRRKTFAATYQFDKFVCGLVDRPPRVLRRYADTRLPLDLSDDELMASESEAHAQTFVASDGWSPTLRYVPSTWHRVRYMWATRKEQVSEFMYLEPGANLEALLRDFSLRCKEENESLPPHLQYKSECWDSGLDPNVCLMLSVVHMGQLQLDFETKRLLEKCDSRHWEATMSVALEMVSVVLRLGTYVYMAAFLRSEFPYLLLGYGLPCVAYLTGTLTSICRSGGALALPANIKKATLVRTLSVYTSHLESVSRPGQGDYHICQQASKAITRALDEILEGTEATTSNGAPQTPLSVTAGGDNQPAAAFATTQQQVPTGTDDFDFLNADGFEGFDLSSWVKNIDWTGTGSEWSTF